MQATDNKKHILIVDDEPINILFLTEILEEHFYLTLVENGEDALTAANNNPPDLILLDIVMPGISGLKVCKTLKKNPEQSHIPVIFLSALDQLSDRMAGYNAGGDYYITKPFSGLEVLTKIKIALNKQQALNEQKQQTENNMQMAMTLMSQNDETDHALHFLKDSFLTKNMDELGQLILDTCGCYGLKVTVRTNTQPPVFFSHDHELKPIDQKILDILHNRKQLIYFGCRSLVNLDRISLLIKNMPIDDDDKKHAN